MLLLGVTHTSNTTLHVLAEIARLPYLNKWGTAIVLDDEGNRTSVPYLLAGCSEAFDNIEPHLQRAGVQKMTRIGEAVSRLVRSKDLVEIGLEVLRQDPTLLLCSNPACEWCVDARRILSQGSGGST